METEIVATTVGSNTTLASVGTAAKVFALAHPMGMVVAGGALLGVASYYTLSKMFKKKDVAPAAEPEVSPVTA